MMKYEEIEKQIGLRLEEVEKITKERAEKENILREQIDKKYKMLTDAGFGRRESYKMLSEKACDYRTLMNWHSGEKMKTGSYKKLIILIEEQMKEAK